MNLSAIRHRILSNPLNKLKSAFGIREIFMLGGLSMLGYGLWLHNPWVAFAVCGSLMMLMGLFMQDSE